MMRKNHHGPISTICMMIVGQRQFWHIALEINFLWKLKFYWNFDLNHPLWLFNLNVFILWQMAQTKVATWNVNKIWKF